jgi:hypothetical protein
MLVLRGELDLRTAWIADEALAQAEKSNELVALTCGICRLWIRRACDCLSSPSSMPANRVVAS